MKKKIQLNNPRLIFIILLVTLFIVFLIYYIFFISADFARNQFTDEMVSIADENEKPTFSIQKILLYSNANAIDNSKEKKLDNVSICQYTDISINIDNLGTNTELTNDNTVKQLYIDNIVIKSQADRGNKILNYKNPMNFGKYLDIEVPTNNRIDYDIINTNTENESHDYSNPTFYTDCSNPITLGYVNKDILTNYAISQEKNTVSFNGKVLQEANIPIDDINYNLNFTIHIVNNNGNKFMYNMSLDVNLNDDNGGIYKGYIYKGKTTTGKLYNFFKEL